VLVSESCSSRIPDRQIRILIVYPSRIQGSGSASRIFPNFFFFIIICRSRVLAFRNSYPDWRTEVPTLLAVLGKNRHNKKPQKKKKAATDATTKKPEKKTATTEPDIKKKKDKVTGLNKFNTIPEKKLSDSEPANESDIEETVSDIDKEVSDTDEEAVSDVGEGVLGGSSEEEEEGDDALFVSTLKSALAKSSNNNKEAEGTTRVKVAERGLNKKKGSMVVKVINLKGE
jgi:hypothetical protein